MTTPKRLEGRKAQVLKAIAWITESRGYPPSYREIAASVGIAHSAVFYVVESLRTDGLINERTEESARHGRAITLTVAGRVALGSADPVEGTEPAIYAGLHAYPK